MNAPGEIRKAAPVGKYRIVQFGERLQDGSVVNVHSNRRVREMLDELSEIDELKSYVPGVFAEDGIPVTVTFCDWHNSFDIDWTLIPCVLTLGICPYCHHEEMSGTVEVARADGAWKTTFAYRECDDWKISFLFSCGSIPYSEKTLLPNEFQACGHGDVLAIPHRSGLAHGIAASLSAVERTAQPKQ